jgi:hypothetical protein
MAVGTSGTPDSVENRPPGPVAPLNGFEGHERPANPINVSIVLLYVAKPRPESAQ